MDDQYTFENKTYKDTYRPVSYTHLLSQISYPQIHRAPAFAKAGAHIF